MYVPAHYDAAEAEALIARLARASAGIIVTIGPDGAPFATHAPLVWDSERRTALGHIARANPHWMQGGGPALAILAGAEAYVSPSFYPSKAQHGKTVPTWNYEAVHLTGQIEWFEDRARVEGAVRKLSDLHEGARAEPWTIEDAPRPYIDSMLRGIIGFELKVERIEAKRKLSQNKNDADFAGVLAGLEASAEPEAQAVARQMRAVRAIADDPDGN